MMAIVLRALQVCRQHFLSGTSADSWSRFFPEGDSDGRKPWSNGTYRARSVVGHGGAGQVEENKSGEHISHECAYGNRHRTLRTYIPWSGYTPSSFPRRYAIRQPRSGSDVKENAAKVMKRMHKVRM